MKLKLLTYLLFSSSLLLTSSSANSSDSDRSKKMETVNQTESIYVVGIELKTSNDKAFGEIPLQWKKFYQESVWTEVQLEID